MDTIIVLGVPVVAWISGIGGVAVSVYQDASERGGELPVAWSVLSGLFVLPVGVYLMVRRRWEDRQQQMDGTELVAAIVGFAGHSSLIIATIVTPPHGVSISKNVALLFPIGLLFGYVLFASNYTAELRRLAG